MERDEFFDTYGVSTLLYQKGGMVKALEGIARAGFRWVELTNEPDGWLPSQEPRPQVLRRHLNRLGLRVHSVHAPFTNIGIGNLDKAKAGHATALVCEAVEGCAEVGGGLVVVHVSEKHYLSENYPKSVEIAREMVYRANEVARRVGVRLVLENMVPYHRPHPRYGWSLAELAKDFPEPEISFCLDTGHAVLSGLESRKEMASVAGRLLSVHAASNDGQSDLHQLPTTGILDWHQVEVGLIGIGYEHRVIIEVMSSADADTIIWKAGELWPNLLGGYGPRSRTPSRA